jgi:hypothetical protein
MEEPHDFEVIIPGSGESIAGKIAKGRTFEILKVSGNLVSKRYSICGYNIDSKEPFLNEYPQLKAAVEQVKEEDMLMVGFDYQWDRHIIHAIFPRRKGSLWYINEEQATEDALLSSLLQEYQAKRLEDTTIGRYEPFFVNLCKHIFGLIPSALTDQMTFDKLTSMEKILHKVLHSQKGIKEDIEGLHAKVDRLLPQSTPTPPSDSTSVPSADVTSVTLQKKNRDSLENQSEENEK